MLQNHDAVIADADGKEMHLSLEPEGQKWVGPIYIDGTRYRLERVSKQELATPAEADSTPEYDVQADRGDYCYILTSFAA
jgi:hypothetical protein